jgi:hypothetical protein
MFCPSCHVLTYPPRAPGAAPTSVQGDTFECTIWQGPSRSRGIEVPQSEREKHFSKQHMQVVLWIDGKRTLAELGQQFWKKPAIIKKALSDDGKDQLLKFFEKHHLLPPEQSLKEKGIVDTVVFEVMTPLEEFKISVTERHETDDKEEQED